MLLAGRKRALYAYYTQQNELIEQLLEAERISRGESTGRDEDEVRYSQLLLCAPQRASCGWVGGPKARERHLCPALAPWSFQTTTL